MKQKLTYYAYIILAVVISLIFLPSCSKDNSTGADDNSAYLIVCADDGTSPSTNPNYYSEIDKAITNNELLYTYHGTYARYDKDYYATHDLFVASDGGFSTNDLHTGRFYETICWWMQGYQIIDSETILWVNLALFEDETFSLDNKYTKLKTVYEGNNFKSLSWYMSKTYYTYVEENNKLYLSNGTILTRTSEGLVADGHSSAYVRYDLNSLK